MARDHNIGSPEISRGGYRVSSSGSSCSSAAEISCSVSTALGNPSRLRPLAALMISGLAIFSVMHRASSWPRNSLNRSCQSIVADCTAVGCVETSGRQLVESGLLTDPSFGHLCMRLRSSAENRLSVASNFTAGEGAHLSWYQTYRRQLKKSTLLNHHEVRTWR